MVSWAEYGRRSVVAYRVNRSHWKGEYLKTKALIAFAAFVLIAGCGKKEGEVAQEQPAQQQPAQQQPTEQKQPAQTPSVTASGIPQVAGDTITTPSGLKYLEMTVGTGEAPQAGQVVQAHYTGWLTDGKKFDSSRDRGQPYPFPLGQGRVIKGWDEGIASMKVGGRRLLIIPSHLAYGPGGRPPYIPGNATLVFDVELVGLQQSGGGQ